jgi:hypothetical protein
MISRLGTWLQVLLGLVPASLACLGGCGWLLYFAWISATKDQVPGGRGKAFWLILGVGVALVVGALGLITLWKRLLPRALGRPAPAALTSRERRRLLGFVLLALGAGAITAYEAGLSAELVPVLVVYVVPLLSAVLMLRESRRA